MTDHKKNNVHLNYICPAYLFKRKQVGVCCKLIGVTRSYYKTRQMAGFFVLPYPEHQERCCSGLSQGEVIELKEFKGFYRRNLNVKY